MSDLKFLGVCIVVAAAMISGTLFARPQAGRYEFVRTAPNGITYVLDTTTAGLQEARTVLP